MSTAPRSSYTYLIVGGGLSAASAARIIRQQDATGSIMLLSDEEHAPYHRPPLSKDLWTGKKTIEKVPVKPREFYDESGIELGLGAAAVAIDRPAKAVTDSAGREYRYKKLLLATGAAPRRLQIPGGRLEGILYFRTLNDYHALRSQAGQGRRALVIGGGFIGSEIAASLAMNQTAVTMLFPGPYICDGVFPPALGRSIQDQYAAKGVEIVSDDRPAAISRDGGRFITQTQGGRGIESDMLVVGIGASPHTEIAARAGLATGNGIVVDELLQTSDADIYAAGDNALFPCPALGKSVRVEHWDNALAQGKHAGRNMTGAREAYTYLPYFYSDLFDFGYEAVGEVNSQLQTVCDWQKENREGVVYYLNDGIVRGVMLCNVWEKLDAARELITSRKPADPQSLAGAIK